MTPGLEELVAPQHNPAEDSDLRRTHTEALEKSNNETAAETNHYALATALLLPMLLLTSVKGYLQRSWRKEETYLRWRSEAEPGSEAES